jgi:hypothetical protein
MEDGEWILLSIFPFPSSIIPPFDPSMTLHSVQGFGSGQASNFHPFGQAQGRHGDKET